MTQTEYMLRLSEETPIAAIRTLCDLLDCLPRVEKQGANWIWILTPRLRSVQ